MTSRLARPFRRALLPFVLLIGIVVSNCGPDSSEPTGPATAGPVSPPAPVSELSLAVAAQTRHTDELLKIRGVVGTAVGLDGAGHARVKVLTQSSGVRGLPVTLEGVPVSAVVTGTIRAFPVMAKVSASEAATAAMVDATKKFARPVPIGVSTGNQGECLAGTISARVKANGKTYALSNNHVYALQNHAAIGSKVLQPGRVDLGCSLGNSAVLGTLSQFVRIKFDTTATTKNKVDAAIAVVSTANLSRHTPSDGYGTPQSNPVAAFLNQQVEKYGRTTGLTTGKVTGLNVVVVVDYGNGRLARFVNQIMIQKPTGAFSGRGDSGSLIVDLNRRPVALLFAGADDGTTFANPIGAVLNALGVSIDGT
jgi:hypothetical protein